MILPYCIYFPCRAFFKGSFLSNIMSEFFLASKGFPLYIFMIRIPILLETLYIRDENASKMDINSSSCLLLTNLDFRFKINLTANCDFIHK